MVSAEGLKFWGAAGFARAAANFRVSVATVVK